jgi:hypothetical protein
MTDNPWRGSGPELLIAAVTVIAAGAAATAVAGWPGLVVVAAGAAALSVVVVRGLSPRSADQTVRTATTKPAARPLSGYAQRRFVISSGIASRGFYEAELRPALEHLLAARLAQYHGVNLYTEPDKARQAFCQTQADEALWHWIDPEQPRPAGQRDGLPGGIPRRTLARLVHRLEHL